ncbi:MAG: alpha-mannosidase [Lachnospiraceae bacterium]|nr:alpha-mannosidase [Lachnospiraceae bacterium]
MDFIKEKIRVMTEKLRDTKLIRKENIEYTFIECPEYKRSNTPPASDAGWQEYVPNKLFEGIDNHYWLHMQIPVMEGKNGEELRLTVKTGREGQWDACNPQFTVFVNGVTAQAMDVNHTWLPLKYDQDYDIYLYLYTGMKGGHFEVNASLETVDLNTEGLYYDIHVPYQCMLELGEESYDYIKIRDCLDKALLRLDLREVYSEEYHRSVEAAREYLRVEFYEKLCGQSDSIVSCIGHTHIDVAWLWTVAQTREKAQRSFSTVINLMRRYGDYIFMSSQPQLYQHVKENDPELYAEIKRAIKEGRWEPEGAMWLESDTNLVHGESLIRQILYGKRFMKEEFGVDNKILWLPDVFGYSAALPQILKKSGVSQFFTSKMSWNETNTMPNDTFIWEGIDGSQVFASMIKTYVCQLDPKTLYSTWKSYKNKSMTNDTLVTFGYGDGGGGPTYEMLENYERLKAGIPGMPKAKIEKAGAFFDRIEADFRKNSAELMNEPRWKGEMYLEMHRGTYTSIAKNKKNNRKSELLYLMAESVAAADMVLNNGSYPEEMIRRNTVNILLNQFHDIIPGSSIKEVYDVTDEEYATILKEGRAMLEEKLAAIRSELKTDGGIFVFNPTPFEISDYIELDGKLYYADKVPAHGWKVIPACEAASDVTVTEKVLENDVIRVEFSDKYHIISVFDKLENREVIAEGGEANRLEIFEDYPRKYDAWEITSYYRQKMWLADQVEKVELLSDGLRIKRKYGKSTITQDICLSKGSKRIDFHTTVDWHEDHVLMKAAFPVDIYSSRATYDIQFGNLERPTHQNTSWDAAKFEVCAHKWADLSEGNYGVSILNDCKYGYSIEDNVMKLSLLKAATYPNPEADRGLHEFTYSLYPHKGDFKEGQTVKEGYLLNTPLEYCMIEANDGSVPDHYAMISCDQENVLVETIKKAEDDDSIIVRLYDTYNQKAEAKLTAAFDYREVWLCDMMEQNIQKLEARDGEVIVPVKNFEIVTLKFVR